MEKRILAAAVLSALFLAVYAQGSTKIFHATPIQQQIKQQNSSPGVHEEQAKSGAIIMLQPIIQEEVIAIKSEIMALEVGKATGAVRRATLTLKRPRGNEEIVFAGQVPLLAFRSQEGALTFRVEEQFPNSVRFVATSGINSYHISYSLDESNPLLNIMITKIHEGNNSNNWHLFMTNAWFKADKLPARYNQLELFTLYKNKNSKTTHRHYIGPFKSAKNVPRGTIGAALSERYFCAVLKPSNGMIEVSPIQSPPESIAIETLIQPMSSTGSTSTYSTALYIGPRDFFYLRKANLEDAFPMGALRQLGLIMLVALSWIARITRNYGVAIVLFSGLITLLMSPFTMLSYRSMKKMQELKPQLDRIMAKHKDDTKKANQEIFALYKAQRVSPISGCLPMLLQMPIFIALFQAISHFIELRGQPFLWITDLSLPDRIAQLPAALPILGRDLNILPIIMAVAMYVQTRTSQQNMPSAGTNPQANMLAGPMMPVLFGVMFYQFPSGLVLYWLTNSLMSMLWYRLAR